MSSGYLAPVNAETALLAGCIKVFGTPIIIPGVFHKEDRYSQLIIFCTPIQTENVSQITHQSMIQ